MHENSEFIHIGFDAGQPYDELPLLPPRPPIPVSASASHLLETHEVLRACQVAHVALAELRQAARYSGLSTLLWRTMPVLEACASCKVEGMFIDPATMLKLPSDVTAERLQQENPGSTRTVANYVLRVAQATRLGYELVQERSLDVSILLELASVVEAAPTPVRRETGVSIIDPETDTTLYTPPAGAENIQRLLGNWEAFTRLDSDSMDPLVVQAVAHYQLSAIQPFATSGGVLARLSDTLLLCDLELLQLPALSISEWICRNRLSYLRSQTEVTHDQRWHAWLLLYLKGVTVAATTAASRIDAISDLRLHTTAYLQSTAPKLSAEPIIELLFSEPCIRIHDLVSRNVAHRQTASVYLKQLVKAGVLEQLPLGKEKRFVHTRLVKILTDVDYRFAPYTDQ